MPRRSPSDYDPGDSYWKELAKADKALFDKSRSLNRDKSRRQGDSPATPWLLLWRVGATELQWAGSRRLFGQIALGSSRLVVFQTDKVTLTEATKIVKVPLVDYTIRPRIPSLGVYDLLASVTMSPEGKLDISLEDYGESTDRVSGYREQGLRTELKPEDYPVLLQYLQLGIEA